MLHPVRVISAADFSGYGHAGICYVRGLVNAGVPVYWTPLSGAGIGARVLSSEEMWRFVDVAQQDKSFDDLAALWRLTQRPKDCPTTFVQTVPELWPLHMRPGKKNVGYTTWEADALPTHWPHPLRSAQKVCVPSTQNQRVFSAALPGLEVKVVPHICRTLWGESRVADEVEFKNALGIPDANFIFYSINTWDHRKNQLLLIEAFATAFRSDEKVSLVIKSTERGLDSGPLFEEKDTVDLLGAKLAELKQRLGRDLPQIELIPLEIRGDAVDLLHSIGSCFVSLSHGEGWGIGAFDAATKGNPVVMTGWGGQCDYLGEEWPGRVAYTLGPAPSWPTDLPSYWPSQNWANPDLGSAVTALRQAYEDHDRHRQHAQLCQQSILERYSEFAVTELLLDAVFD